MTEKDILIIDDEDFIRDLLTDFLSLEGFRCRPVATAEQAFEAVDTMVKPFDLILLDRHLEKSRAEVVINAFQERHLTVPIILLTGDHEVDTAEAQKMGATDVIHKPFQIDSLLQHILSILEPS